MKNYAKGIALWGTILLVGCGVEPQTDHAADQQSSHLSLTNSVSQAEKQPESIQNKHTSSATSCPFGNGYYCGGNNNPYGAYRDWLLYCYNGSWFFDTDCRRLTGYGCGIARPGVNDYCIGTD